MSRALLDTIFAALQGRVVDADACYERVLRFESARAHDGQRSTTPHASKSGLVVRLIGTDGRNLEVSLGDVSPMEARLRLDEALIFLDALSPDPTFRLAPLPIRDQRHFGPAETPLGPPAELYERVNRCVDDVEALVAGWQSGRTTEAQVTFAFRLYTQAEDKIVADAQGLFRSQSLPQTFLQVEFITRSGVRRGRSVVRFGDVRGLDEFLSVSGTLAARCRLRLNRGLDHAHRMLEARALTAAERAAITHYVLEPDAMVFIHEACGHNFEADIVASGRSGLFTRDGRPIDEALGSEAVRLVDGPPLDALGAYVVDRGFGSQYIDDEGVEVAPVVLLDRGRVTGMLHNRETAARFSATPNGRGFSELGQPRLVRMTNTYLLPSSPEFVRPTLEAFLEGVTFGVWLSGSYGGQVSAQGMSSSIQSGRIIRDGRLTDEWLLPCTFTVQTRLALKSVESFFGPPEFDRPGFCGKGQTKTVTEGGCAARLAAHGALSVGW